MISFDTETTGNDFRHGAKPYFVTTCGPGGKQIFWEWDVDPLTREPEIPASDLIEIEDLLTETDGVVLQNAKFDVTAMAHVKESFGDWPWEKTWDTLLAGHLLGSNRKHNLTDMAVQYLGVDIEPLEEDLKEACDGARRYCRTHYEDWRIAKEGLPEMPSAKAKCWKCDTWLPKRLAQELAYDEPRAEKTMPYKEAVRKGLPVGHPWYTVARDYANADSAVTYALITVQIEEIKRRGLWQIYLERLKVLPVSYRIERRGVTLSLQRLEKLEKEYAEESRKAEAVCVNIADDRGYELKMPKAGNNQSLVTFCFEGLKLPEIKWSDKTGDPSLDKEVLSEYLTRLPAKFGPHSAELLFVRKLLAKRKRDTALSYMEGYKRFLKPWVPVGKVDPRTGAGWYILHPSLNPTGSDTLRWTSSNPNEQNISKQEGFNLRYCFGPAPGREWWSLDAKNIELRIPAYESGETDLIYVFDHPDEAPYYGSYHLFIFDLLHPELFKKHGKACKELFESTWYQWIKNGNFAVIYGAQEEKADATYHVKGAFNKIRYRFPRIAALADRQIELAQKTGYVETMPDRNVNPKRGYPLLIPRTDRWDTVEPTKPLNYHVSGTAMWWMQKAMVRCDTQLEQWRAKDQCDAYIVMQVHDELVFDFPKSSRHPNQDLADYMASMRFEADYGRLPQAGIGQSNMWRIRVLQRLMEMGGGDIGLPTPVGVEYHDENWSVGLAL